MHRTLLVVSAVLACSCAGTSPSGQPSVERGYAPVNGLQMYYEVHGASDGMTPPLLLLHGGGSTIQSSFSRLLPALARSRRVIAVEQQGHGRTADVDRPFGFEQSAEDTVALLHHLGVERADVLGYSNGGHIALQIALTHPGVVRKLVVESAMFDKDGADPAFWASFKDARIADMPAELRDAYLETAPHPENLPSFFEKSVTRMKEFKGWRPEQIRTIQAPTLVVCGDRDVVRPEHAVETYRLLPHGQLAILPDSDHMKMVARGDWLVPMVESFLNAPMPAKD